MAAREYGPVDSIPVARAVSHTCASCKPDCTASDEMRAPGDQLRSGAIIWLHYIAIVNDNEDGGPG